MVQGACHKHLVANYELIRLVVSARERSSRSASHILMTDCRATPRRLASLSSASTIQIGKSTLTRCGFWLIRRALARSRPAASRAAASIMASSGSRPWNRVCVSSTYRSDGNITGDTARYGQRMATTLIGKYAVPVRAICKIVHLCAPSLHHLFLKMHNNMLISTDKLATYKQGEPHNV